MFSSMMALSFLCYIGPLKNLPYLVINSGDALYRGLPSERQKSDPRPAWFLNEHSSLKEKRSAHSDPLLRD